MSHVIHVNDGDFASIVLESDKPVLVDFWATWCGPCKAIGPILEELADELIDQVVITKMNVDDNQETPVQLGIRSLPTLILFKDGKQLGTQVGAQSKAQLLEFIQNAI